MPEKNLNKFFLSIVIPSILAIVLFIISFFVIIIPQFENNMMTGKKEMIQELTNSAWSILYEQDQEFEKGNITRKEAQENAARQIEQMRYGSERKDYFWIIDYTPVMIMHPYLKELNGTNLSDFKDSHEKKLFVDAAQLVKKEGEGYIDYYWQWKDDTTRIVPKLSYVKGFDKWQWLVGTGIYLNDVKEEMAHLKNRLLTISAFIIGIIILTLIYVIRQSLNIEKKRKAAEQKLIQSKQKYKTLVEASTEGTLMFVDGKVTFNNLKFAHMIDCETKELTGMHFNDLFAIEWTSVLGMFTDPKQSVSTETTLKCNEKTEKEVVVSISKIEHQNQETFIVIAKDLSTKKHLEKSTQALSQELQTSLLLMNQPIKSFIREIISCTLETSIKDAALLMASKNQKIIFVKNGNSLLGVVNDSDLKKRVLAKEIDSATTVSEIMTAPVLHISENALLYEAVLLFKREQVSHLLVKNAQNQISGAISNQDALEVQRNALSYLIQEIESSHKVEEIKQIYTRLPVLVNAILANSDNAQNTTRIITSVADAITKRVIEMAIEQQGNPPCAFAFMAMGSEGRMEQTLKTDQDNALVLAENHTENDVSYFLGLAKSINKNLNQIGYVYCNGNIMASNKAWCLSLNEWKKHFSYWIQTPDPQNILDSSIFFDFRCIYGEKHFVDELRAHVSSEAKENDLFFYHLANSIIKFKPSMDTDTIHLKKLILPLIGYVRTMALKNQLHQTNTIERLDALFEKEHLSNERKTDLIQVYNFLMQLRLRHQAIALLGNEVAGNEISYSKLSPIEQITLKKAQKEIGELQTELSILFKHMT